MNPNHIFLIVAVSLFLFFIGLLIHIRLKRSKEPANNNSQENKNSSRHWFQWVLGLPILVLALAALFSGSPEAVFYEGMSQVDVLYNIASIAGYYFPSVLLLLIAYFILKKRNKGKAT